MKKLLPHVVTLVLAALLVLTQQVWSGPLTSRLASRTAQTASSKTTVNYQGYLIDSSGSSVNDTLDMVFRLYDVESGGTHLWTETQLGVPVTDGLFSVLLGSVNVLPQSLFEQNDDLWLGITIGADEEMTPRDKITSVPYAITGGMPSGVIVMWSGSLSEIPDGWALCDGTNGTPDLRDRFVLSVAASEEPGGTGGSHTKSLSVSNLPPHTHSFTTDSAGEHVHDIAANGGSQGIRRTGSEGGERRSGEIYPAGEHTHSGTTHSTGGGNSFDVRPRYYKLAFIMKLP